MTPEKFVVGTDIFFCKIRNKLDDSPATPVRIQPGLPVDQDGKAFTDGKWDANIN